MPSLIHQAIKKPTRVWLKRDLRRQLLRGHPWVYRNAIEIPDHILTGTPSWLEDKKGLLGLGFVDPQSSLAFRMCYISMDPNVKSDWAEQRAQTALRMRKRFLHDQTTGFRLFNGEGDGLPGLVVDLYNKHAVVRLDGAGPRAFWKLDGICSWLRKNIELDCIIEKKRGEPGRVLWGAPHTTQVEFKENGQRFLADLIHGQKTGFFLDQRENRKHIGSISSHLEVLNLFSYTGGFSVYAAAGGASSVTSVDAAAPAIEMAKTQFEINNLQTEHHAIAQDAFEYLENAVQDGRKWGLVVVDPPSFAPSEKALPQALAAYTRIFTLAAKVCADNGFLALASCSSHVTDDAFWELCQTAIGKARCRARILYRGGQPFDHPYPLACPELKYLKFLTLQLVG
jgi:23S rRNA (cytosine1962-C5)-methyltransferase